jgi:hypothetical protein
MRKRSRRNGDALASGQSGQARDLSGAALETSPVVQCEHNIRSRLIKRLKRKPALHYADVDTQGYPNGAVRGQLSR